MREPARPAIAAQGPWRDAAAGVTPRDTAGDVPQVARLNTEDFADRFRASFRTLWTIAAGIVNDPAGADDAVQEAALTALSKLGEFDPTTNFTAWMARIVRYVALNHARRDRRQPASVDPVAMDESRAAARVNALRSEAGSPGVRVLDDRGQIDLEHTPFDDRMMRALGSVGETARACLLLRTIEGLNYEEIARLLDIPAGTAMSHVHRTRILLRQRLADLNPACKR
jgi:RNA polymerase sigma-70 factor (ECF subfamily)